MADREEALREFVAVTGVEEERARFFLESAGWDLQVAPSSSPSAAGALDRELGLLQVQGLSRRPLPSPRPARVGLRRCRGGWLGPKPVLVLSLI